MPHLIYLYSSSILFETRQDIIIISAPITVPGMAHSRLSVFHCVSDVSTYSVEILVLDKTRHSILFIELPVYTMNYFP